MFNTGVFTEAEKEWDNLPRNGKSWFVFKKIYGKEHKKIMKKKTARTAGYNANGITEESKELQQQTLEALTDLAEATVSDRETVANLVKSNNKLSHQLADLNRLQETVANLTKKVDALCKKVDAQQYNTRNTENKYKEKGRKSVSKGGAGHVVLPGLTTPKNAPEK